MRGLESKARLLGIHWRSEAFLPMRWCAYHETAIPPTIDST